MNKAIAVSGQISAHDGATRAGLVVRAYAEALPSLKARGMDERQLGADALTDANGRYRIEFGIELSDPDRGRALLTPDLLIRVFDDETLLGQSAVVFAVADDAVIDLAVALPERSEFELLLVHIGPSLQGVALADLSDEDLVFLKGLAGTDPERHGIAHPALGFVRRTLSSLAGRSEPVADWLAMLRSSARLARETGVSAEVFYGLARQGHALALDGLIATPDADLYAALVRALDHRIIPAVPRDQLNVVIRRLKRYNHVVYMVTGQLIDRASGLAVEGAGFEVHAVDVGGSAGPVDLGIAAADDKGLFSFACAGPVLPTASAPIAAALRLRLEIFGAGTQLLGEHDLVIAMGHRGAVQVPVSIPEPAREISAAITEIFASSRAKVPSTLATYLASRNLYTLDDIRRAGGLASLADLPFSIDHPAVTALNAHADLSRLSADVSLNGKLIDNGYASVTAISDAPRALFVATAQIGEFEAAQLHAMARAQSALLDNALIGAAAAQANGFAAEVTAADGAKLFAETCACEDCDAATSPAIYLADLLSYTTGQVVQRAGPTIDLAFLTATLHQPFAGLRRSCDAVTQSVHRARIGVEVLRAYLGPRPLADTSKEADLESAEKTYLVAAYTTLLNRIGTSYDEIRLARTATPEQRQTLADRLGIDLTVPRPAGLGDELDRLFLDVFVPLGSAGANVALRELERNIEGLFGLADTARNPLSDGAKFGDDADDLLSGWQLRHVEWARNTDLDGNVFVSVDKVISPGQNAIVRVYKDAQRQQLVARAIGAGALSAQGGSGLDGYIFLGPGVQSFNECTISAIPSFLAWRSRALRTQWSQQDHPADVYADVAPDLLPFIDPDLIGPDDFRLPIRKFQATDPDTPFDLWLARRGIVDQMLLGLQNDRENNADGFNLILREAFHIPLPDFDALLRDLTQGDQVAVARATQEIAARCSLSLDSFARLMALRTKVIQATDGPGEPVSEAEWNEIYSILVQVKKARLLIAWRQEEQQLQPPLILGLRDFWPALREPALGDWPLKSSPDIPLIDPELVSLKDLPDGVAGAQAIQFWNDRWLQIRQTIPSELANVRSANGFDAMVAQALGTPPGTPLPPQDNLDALRAELASSNPTDVAAAQTAIKNDLRLTLDGFDRLMRIRDQDAGSDKTKKPTAADYAEVYATLTDARKLKTEYPRWASEELASFGAEGQAAGEPVGEVAYWRARKAALPRWRATAVARRAWEQALQARSALPIIDPDLIDAFDLRDPVAGNAAQDLLASRSTDVTARMAALEGAQALTTAAFDQLLGDPDYLGVGFDSAALDLLNQERNQGRNIQSRLDQLGLDNASFDALVRVSKLVASNQRLLASEWTDVASILVQCYKRKQFAAWRLVEAGSITLGPDLFQIRPAADGDPIASAPAPVLVAYRATAAARRAWDDTLQSRVNDQSAIVSGMRDAVIATEGATLAPLRDGLVLATDASPQAPDLASKADELAERLLIDFQTGADQQVTRVEQAIETVQSLLYAVRTGLGGEHITPPLKLAIGTDEFDAKWKWLGSYATWRSAMLVFQYPETLLLPTLRPKKWQTPAFKQLVETLSNGGSVDAEAACRAAGAYSAYFRDVCGLIVDASCHASMPILGDDTCLGFVASDVSHDAFFMFARSRYTNKVYWSVLDLDSAVQSGNQDFAQSYWVEIQSDPIANIIAIVGATSFFTEGNPYIYLFAHVQGEGSEQLYALRLNLHDPQYRWEFAADLTPSGAVSFKPQLVQGPHMSLFQRVGGLDNPPSILIGLPNGALLLGNLAPSGTAWAGGSPPLLSTNYGQVLAVARHGTAGDDVFVGLVTNTNDEVGWRASFGPRPAGQESNLGEPPDEFHGLVWLPTGTSKYDGSGVEFFILSGANPLPLSKVSTPYRNDAQILGAISLAGLQRIAIWAGQAPDKHPYQFCYGLADTFANCRRCSFALGALPGTEDVFLSMASDDPLAPNVQEALRNVPFDTSSDDLQVRRQQIADMFLANDNYPQSLRSYFEEAFYFVPMQIALKLQESAEYEAALGWFRTVYDFAGTGDGDRRIYYGLVAEDGPGGDNYKWSLDWLGDALNPHTIARTRRNSYTKYTLLCIVQCLLDYADSEFSQDSGESLARARALYEKALELLNADALKSSAPDCHTIFDDLVSSASTSSASAAQLVQLSRVLKPVSDPLRLRQAVAEALGALNRAEPGDGQFAAARQIADDAAADAANIQSIGAWIEQSAALRTQRHRSMLADRALSKAVERAGSAAAAKALDPTSHATGRSEQRLEPAYMAATMGQWGCIPEHPILGNLKLNAQVSLQKMRAGRNIAGMKRDLEPYAAPTSIASALPSIGAGGQISVVGTVAIQPTIYRYAVLVDRARQFAGTAAQIEAQMLAAMERHDEKAYGLLTARQDLGVARANVSLQGAKVGEANDRVQLASLQRGRVSDQIDHYQQLLLAPVNAHEQQALDLLKSAANNFGSAADLSSSAADAYGVSAVFGGATGAVQGAEAGAMVGAALGPVGAVVGGVVGGVLGAIGGSASGNAAGFSARASQASSTASRESTTASIMSTLGSYERRAEDWQYQLQLANDDAQIGDAQVGIAKDDVGIARQEESIAKLQYGNARDSVEFLANAFTNPDLYGWMSGVLQRVYGYFLRQATAIAKLAENQLAFERLEVPRGLILADYWAPSTAMQPSGTPAPDRKGLTGAERLLEAIAALDQYAFLTDSRKLQLTKTFSLGRLAPAEFQRFRETGVMVFSTPMAVFDRSFPGHYLRLIKRVNTSVVALIPPNQGICATLSNGGLSRAVVWGDAARAVPIRRDPEAVALSSPIAASGVFNLMAQSDTMLLPFEGGGVDTSWELRMEKASNPFDFGTIADVLVSIDYTALSSADYRRQVIQSLGSDVSAERPYSLRNQLADQWYDLHNPDQSNTPMTVRFASFAEDFPPNIDDPRIQQVLLYFSRADGKAFEIAVAGLRFTEQGTAGAIGGAATSIDGVISTRRGNAPSWTPMIGKKVVGDWELALADNDRMRAYFADDDIQDILFVITYSGQAAEWAA